MSIGKETITGAELKGIHQGLYLAWELGFRKIIVETDSTAALNLIESSDDSPYTHTKVVREIKNLLRRCLEVRLKHILREANFYADALTLRALNLSISTHMIFHPPTAII